MPRKDYDNAEAELRALETELVSLLRAELSTVIDGRNTLFFFNDEYNPHNFPAFYFTDSSRAALQLARKTIDLHRLLVLPTEKCVGQLFIDACEESADLNNPHRLGPRRLAERLLSQLDNRSF